MAHKQKILAVDDEARNLKILLLGLGDTWEVKTASNGDQALELARSFEPDVILLDIMMPGMDGYEVCRLLKADPRFALTKVILVSGKAMIEERLQGYDTGADDYLTKPFIPEELTAKVRVFMRLTKAERDLQLLNSSLEDQVKQRTEQLLNAEAKLINAAKMAVLGEMAGSIAHEINTPLATINMLNSQMEELLRQGSVNTELFLKITVKVEAIIQRIAKIINGLRAFSRGDDQEPTSSFSVLQIVEDTVGLCGEAFKQRSIALNIDMKNPALRAECRASQVSQVILNLLNNARDATQDLNEKWIRLEVSELEKEVQIRLTDSGSGIPKELSEKLFQPFFTTKELGKGTGLGLSISKGLIEAQKGSLVLDDTALNTTFVVKIPKAAA